VGLVLSGGGAKGITHIGVIRALEDQGIPIDYITGTSMGAIIGGLYASGYSPDEMIKIITSKEFPEWVTGEINEKYVYYFKNNEPKSAWFSFSFDYDSLVLPSLIPANIISPMQMDFALMDLFSGASAAAKYNFDSLMIPFRCVASDISESKPVVLRDGNLSTAIRASMTFPFFFKPIRLNGKLLFDGGMYNNFPSDVMMNEFHPDVVIGSKAASNYDPPQENNILSQIQTMLMAKTDFNMHSPQSVLISPDMPSVGLLDFGQTQAFIDSGYYATVRKIDEIKAMVKLNVRRDSIAAKRNRFRIQQPPILIDTIFFKGVKKNQAKYLDKSLLHKSKNSSLTQLKSEYFKLIADDKIQSIYPSLSYDRNSGFYDLYLDVEKEKNTTISFGGNISPNPINEAFFGIQYKTLGRQAMTLSANSYIGRFYSSAYLGLRADFATKIPFYLEGNLCFNQWDYFKTSTYFFEDKTPSYLIKNENHFEADLGFPYGNQGRFVAGLTVGHIRNDYYQNNFFGRTDTADKSYFDMMTTHLLFEINTLNKREYANKGTNTSIEFRHIWGTEKYLPGSTSLIDAANDFKQHHNWLQLKMTYQNYFQRIGKLSLGFYLESMFSTQQFFQNYTASILMAPEFDVIPETRTLFMPSYRAHNYIGSGIQSVFSILTNLDFRFEAYIFQPYQEIIKKNDQTASYGNIFEKRYFQNSSILVYHSPFGPISLSLNYYEGYEKKFSLFFNIGYIIFNKRVLD
jgi:NTE family protein